MTHRVTITNSGKTFTVDNEGLVLEAALRQEIALPFGCQTGGCGACRALLVKGQIAYDHEPASLTPAETERGYILLCQARAMSDLTLQVEELPDHHAIRVRNLPARVARRDLLCHDVMALFLQLPKAETFEFLAGQYVDILLRDGRRRSFSLANAPSPGGNHLLELHLRHVPHGQFSDYVFTQMPDRAMLRIEGPLGNFYLRENDRPILMLGGGTGLAPLKGMIEYAVERRLSRPIHLYWGVRAKRDLYFDAPLRHWARERPTFKYTPVLSEPMAEDQWQGRTGFVHEAVLADYPLLANHDVYMSGPPVMIQAGKENFTRRGLSLEHLHYDSFDYAFQTWPGQG